MGWKTFIFGVLIGIGIVLAIAVGIGVWTYFQAKEMIAIAKDSTLKEDTLAALSGDCSKLEVAEYKIGIAKSKIESGCKNPIIRYFAKRYVTEMNFCDVANLTQGIDSNLNKAKLICNVTFS